MHEVEYSELQDAFPDVDPSQEADLDYYQISLKTDAGGLDQFLQMHCGTMSLLAANLQHQQRSWKYPKGYMLLSLQPVILLTKQSQRVKELICTDLSMSGFAAVPTEAPSKFLVYGQVSLLIKAIIYSVIYYGFVKSRVFIGREPLVILHIPQ